MVIMFVRMLGFIVLNALLSVTITPWTTADALHITDQDVQRCAHASSLEEMKQTMTSDMTQLEKIKVEITNAKRIKDLTKEKELQGKAAELFVDLQCKYDVIKQVYDISKNIEVDIEDIQKEFPYYSEHHISGTDHIAESVIFPVITPAAASQLLPAATGYRNKNDLRMKDGQETQADVEDKNLISRLVRDLERLPVDDFEVVLTDAIESLAAEERKGRHKRDVSLSDLETLKELVDFEKFQLKANELYSNESKAFEKETIEDLYQDKTLKEASCPSLPRATGASTWLWQKQRASGPLLTCAANVNKRVKIISKGIAAVNKIATNLDMFNSAVNTMSRILKVVEFVPIVGDATTFARLLMTPFKISLSDVTTKIVKLDNKLQGKFKTVINLLRKSSAGVKALFTAAQTAFKETGTRIDTKINNLCPLSADKVKRESLTMWAEFIMTSNEKRKIDEFYNLFPNPCKKVDDVLARLQSSISLPTLNKYESTLMNIKSVLNPILAVLLEIEKALNKELCMLNVIELTREGLERGREWVVRTAEEAREWFRGWRRRRRRYAGPLSSSDVFLSKSQAISFLKNKHDKADNICFTVQQLLDGIGKAFDFLFGWANDIITELISRIPGINKLALPGPNIGFHHLLSFDVGNLEDVLPSKKIDWSFLDNQANIPGMGQDLRLPGL